MSNRPLYIAYIGFGKSVGIKFEYVLYAIQVTLLLFGLGAIIPLMYASLHRAVIELFGSLELVD